MLVTPTPLRPSGRLAHEAGARLAPPAALATAARRARPLGARRFGARVALVWLLLALVLVPLLGRLHQITHGDTLDHLHTGPSARLHAEQSARLHAGQSARLYAGQPVPSHAGKPLVAAAAHTHHQASLFDQLAGHHSAADCLLLDQLTLGNAPPHTPTALPAPPPAQLPPAPPTDRVGVLHVALFQARGPPQG